MADAPLERLRAAIGVSMTPQQINRLLAEVLAEPRQGAEEYVASMRKHMIGAANTSREDLASIRSALGELPDVCRYHQDRLDPDRPGWGREACCDTGLPALRRREAMAALDRIEANRG